MPKSRTPAEYIASSEAFIADPRNPQTLVARIQLSSEHTALLCADADGYLTYLSPITLLDCDVDDEGTVAFWIAEDLAAIRANS